MRSSAVKACIESESKGVESIRLKVERRAIAYAKEIAAHPMHSVNRFLMF